MAEPRPTLDYAPPPRKSLRAAWGLYLCGLALLLALLGLVTLILAVL